MCFTMGNIEEGKSSTSDKSSPAPPVSCEYLHFSGGNRYPHVPLLFQTKNLIGKTFCYLFMWSSAFLTSKNKLRLVSYGKLWFWFVCCDLVEFFFSFEYRSILLYWQDQTNIHVYPDGAAMQVIYLRPAFVFWFFI